jgi:hypothetical protein
MTPGNPSRISKFLGSFSRCSCHLHEERRQADYHIVARDSPNVYIKKKKKDEHSSRMHLFGPDMIKIEKQILV